METFTASSRHFDHSRCVGRLQLTAVRISVVSVRPDYGEVYCLFETFRPQCLKNEVVVIERAVYGRRYLSRCLETEEFDFNQHPEFLNCSADAIGYLNAKCSGKKHCEIRVPDPNLQQAKPCPKGLDMFLEVHHSCVEVVDEDRSCVVSVTSSPVHIARNSLSESPRQESRAGLHCGTRTQPWLLEAPAGQRIDISLLDFTSSTGLPTDTRFKDPSRASPPSGGGGSGSSESCEQQQKSQYGYIVDKSATAANKKNVSICGGTGSARRRSVYLSTSNVVEIVLSYASHENTNSSFLVRVEAVGCSDLIPPEDAWLKRTDNEAIVGCYTSRQTWHLKCEDRRWVGVVSNCTQYAAVMESYVELKPSAKNTYTNSHQLLLIVAVAFAGVAVCLTIICCGIYCLRRYSSKEIQQNYNAATFKYSHVAGSTVNSQCCQGTTPNILTSGNVAGKDQLHHAANGDIIVGANSVSSHCYPQSGSRS